MHIYERAALLASQFAFVLEHDAHIRRGQIVVDTETRTVRINPADSSNDAC